MSINIINDNIHGAIELSDISMQIINTSEFQRLRNISQLGNTHYVFPSATHTRFIHSIGVAYLARKLLQQIRMNQPEIEITDQDIINVELAGLCHDLGHGICSHLFDEFIEKYANDEQRSHSEFNYNKHHEKRSCIILEHIIHNDEYNIDLSEENMNIIKEMIYPNSPNDSFLYHIICNSKNGTDVDKFDYMCRDTQAVGLKYSFDYERIFKRCRVINDELCYHENDITNIYDLFYGRYKNHKIVYQHHTVRSIDYMLLDILEIINNDENLIDQIHNIDLFLEMNIDILPEMYVFGKNIDENNNELVKIVEILKRIKTRNLYKYIGKLKNNEITLENILEIDEKLNENNTDNDPLDISQIILEQNRVQYISGFNGNPIDNIKFYNSKNNNNSYYINDGYQLLPTKFEEKSIRIFCKDNNLINHVKNIYNYLNEYEK
jgi:HD superfamily phosphohydrolase